MISWRLPQPGEIYARLVNTLEDLVSSGLLLRWIVVVGVGLFLGIYAIGVTYLPGKVAPLITAGVVGVFAMMAVGNMQRVLLAAIILDAPVQFDINLFYREDAAQLGALFGVTVSFTTLALIGLYSLWITELLTKLRKQTGPLFKMAMPGALYVFLAGLSILVAHDRQLALFEFTLLIQFLLLFVYLVGNVRSRDDIKYIITLIMLVLILESLLMILVRVLGRTIQAGSLMIRIDNTGRVGGTVGSPINAASYLTLVMAPLLGIWLMPLSRRYKWLAGGAFALGGLALVLTLSRGAWIGTMFSVGAFSFLAWRRGWLDIRIILVAVFILAVVAFGMRTMIIERLTTDDGGSAESRLPLMQLAFRMIQDHPIGGVGANNVPVVIHQYATPELGNVWLYSIHNKYLLVWSETGPLTLLAYLAFLLVTLRRGWRVWRFNDRFLSPLALGFTVAIMGSMFHMFFDVFRSRPEMQTLWVNSALIVAMLNMEANHEPREQHSSSA